MECEYCNKIIKNKGAYTNHVESCERVHKNENEILRLYTEDFLNINKLGKKFNLGKEKIIKILGNKKRTISESIKLAHKLYPEKYKHSDESKQKMREKRLEFMKNNPDKTAWRKSNMSYPEKLFLNKIKELKWNDKHLIVREKSVFPYFIDFAFMNEKIAVEIDGSQHNLEERVESDGKKDIVLKDNDWRVFRVTAKEVISNIDNVISMLESFFNTNEEYVKFGILTNKEYNTEKRYYCKCGNEKTKYGKNCTKCGSLSQRKVERPPYKTLLKLIDKFGYTGTGKKYNVSDNAIRKWKKNYENQLNFGS